MILVYTLYLIALAAFVGLNLKFNMPKVCAVCWTVVMVGLGFVYDIPYIEFMLTMMAFPVFLLFSPRAFFFLSAQYEQSWGALSIVALAIYLFSWLWFEVMLRMRGRFFMLALLIAFPPLAFVFWIPAFYKKRNRLAVEGSVLPGNISALKAKFDQAAQGHVFDKWCQLTPDQQTILLKQIAGIDLDEVNKLANQVRADTIAGDVSFQDIQPPHYTPFQKNWRETSEALDVYQKGEVAIKDGRVALFTVAGGQGTRLGIEGPKGLFPITPIKQKSLFQVFAEKIKAEEIQYERSFHWFIMTSPMGHHETVSFFKKHNYFDLEYVHIFQQGCMPAVDMDGKLLMQKPYQLAMSPDGHGGSLRALVRNGCLDIMEKEGIDILSYFQVDNPLVQVMDPYFVGLHLSRSSEMSSKMTLKRDANEKVGLFCQLPGDKLTVVEYSDLPQDFNDSKDESGLLKYRCANLGIHLLDKDFIRRVGSSGVLQLPFHFAKKKVPYENANGDWIEPSKPNAIKFEMFIFDALREAKSPLLLETLRELEFSPVKNAKGSDSPEACMNDQQQLFAKWLESAGVSLTINNDGVPEYAIEISPLFARTEEEFIVKWDTLNSKPDLTKSLYIE